MSRQTITMRFQVHSDELPCLHAMLASLPDGKLSRRNALLLRLEALLSGQSPAVLPPAAEPVRSENVSNRLDLELRRAYSPSGEKQIVSSQDVGNDCLQAEAMLWLISQN